MKFIVIILLIALAFFVGVNIGGYFYQIPRIAQENSTYNLPEGFTSAEPRINGTTVFLISGCRVISFDVTPDQAYSIEKGLERSFGARPLTHDLIADILDVFDIKVLQIRIDRYDNDIYYATIVLRQRNRILEMDARPSDSIALALRTKVPVYFKESLLDTNARRIC